MDNRLLEIWEEARINMKNELMPLSFSTWIENVVPIAIEGNTLILQTSGNLNRNILENRYNDLITNTIKYVTNQDFIIKYIIPEENTLELKKVKEKDHSELFETTNLNPRYVFNEFVVGNSNRFAHAASLAVAESPAKSYNPLFIYGGVGLGKTHLMHAIGHYILSQNKNAKVYYVSSEKFTNELINSIKDDKNEEFRNKYRTVDVLLVDDIQFIAGKERTQEEFFHTFNALYEENKQIIVSSDRPPKEIPTLEDRLRSRFEWGLITDIQPPDYETRIAILKKKSERDRIDIPGEVFEFIASKIKSNIRELEGALNRVVAYSTLTKREVDISLVNEALKDIFSTTRARKIDVDFIKSTVAEYFNMKIEDFESKKRTRQIAYPRQIAMYIARELTDLSLPKIGEEFGGRDHTTVIHACEKISTEMLSDYDLKNKIDGIIKEIKGE
ncbi:chromosomal replication initiator protein DnaA [Fusibacter bizertensis]|jgi:chromosomal replication initiator protein DnaA|uniref:Chromosomal replication initiator protein DnaA n=1 Tax=Fusibacter bizertensis TaxID=1488331 RepID=A0ABT6NFG5_9FIRM|nr:chromosomal replication initiator protein DnaA [Fusibacter bizertensis]MDH8679173.1 chromosomal replication initiator protein DnaA [Fusibacter bizertensis]